MARGQNKQKGIAPRPQQQLAIRLNKINNQLYTLLCFNFTFVLSKSKQNPTKPLCCLLPNFPKLLQNLLSAQQMLIYLLCSLKMKNDERLSWSWPTSSTAKSQEIQTVNPLWSDFNGCTLVLSQTSEVYYAILVLMYKGSCNQRTCIKHNQYQKSQFQSNTILF